MGGDGPRGQRGWADPAAKRIWAVGWLIGIGIVEVICRKILVEIFRVVLDLVTRELFVKFFFHRL